MNAIEPNWISLLWFAVLASVATLAFLNLAGMFPRHSRPQGAQSAVATLLIAGNAVLLVVLLTGTGLYGYAELRWSTLIVVAGLVALFAPGLLQVWPFRDGSSGLVVLTGVQLAAMAILVKVAGRLLETMS